MLTVIGGLLAFGALFGSASYEGEAKGLLFDEDTFAIFTLGLVPFVSGLLFVCSKLFSRSDTVVHSSSR